MYVTKITNFVFYFTNKFSQKQFC